MKSLKQIAILLMAVLSIGVFAKAEEQNNESDAKAPDPKEVLKMKMRLLKKLVDKHLVQLTKIDRQTGELQFALNKDLLMALKDKKAHGNHRAKKTLDMLQKFLGPKVNVDEIDYIIMPNATQDIG